MKRRYRLYVSVCAAAVSVPALAQNNPAGAEDAAVEQAVQPAAGETSNPATADKHASEQLGDIVVIGRKRARAEALQRVPVAITALSAAQLQQSTVRNLVDVGGMVPNASLQASSQKGVQNFAIRGMGVSGTTPSDEPAVGIFQDGVYWGSNYGALNELFDLEGVEILRGPQGTLFGRNVTGGAVSIRSARPSQTPYSNVTLGVSNGLGVQASAVINRPITDTLSGRIAVLDSANDGIFYNSTLHDSFGRTYTHLIRPSLKWAPSSKFDVTLLGEYYGSEGDPVAIRGIAPSNYPGGPPTLADLAGYKSSPDYSVLQAGDRGSSNINVYFGMAEANLKIGPGTLTSITGYRQVRSRNTADFDGFPVEGFLQYVATNQHQVSEELRYAADFTSWLSVTAGAYYFDQHLNYAESRDLNNHLTRVATRATLANSSYAGFAEADIKPFDKITVTLGGRYTHERKVATSAPFGACPFNLIGACTFTTAAPYKGNNFSPKVGLSYQIDPNKLIYASWTRGFRSGGFSLRGTALGAPYQAETVNAYEVGVKTDFLDHHLRLNVSGFYNKFANLQRTVLGVDPILGVVQAVFNAANADIKGVELEITAIPVRGLTLSGNYGYTDAKYKSFLGFSNPGSLQFVRVPRNTGDLSAGYETSLPSGDKVGLRVSGQYTGRLFFDDANHLYQKGYWLIDANVHYTFNTRLTLTAYGRNLANKNYATYGSSLGALGENVFPGDPRTYGVRASFTF